MKNEEKITKKIKHYFTLELETDEKLSKHLKENFLDKQNKDITNTVYSGFLTKDEITKIHNGQEVWIDQKSGISRLKHFKSIKQRLLK